LKNSGVILGAAGLKREGHQVLRGLAVNPCRRRMGSIAARAAGGLLARTRKIPTRRPSRSAAKVTQRNVGSLQAGYLLAEPLR
jgi:hypothetical protein